MGVHENNCPQGHELVGDNVDVRSSGQRRCKACRNAYDALRRQREDYVQIKLAEARRRLYGLNSIDFQHKLESQNNKCACCRDVFTARNPPCVDHDHDCCSRANNGRKSCGKCLRDLLCADCNLGISRFKDSSLRTTAATNYLRKWGK